MSSTVNQTDYYPLDNHIFLASIFTGAHGTTWMKMVQLVLLLVPLILSDYILQVTG